MTLYKTMAGIIELVETKHSYSNDKQINIDWFDTVNTEQYRSLSYIITLSKISIIHKTQTLYIGTYV